VIVGDTTYHNYLYYCIHKSIINHLKTKTMKANQISIAHFDFQFSGYGHYKVTYTSPVTGKSWTKIIDDMTIIDETKNADYPKIKSLNHLKSIVKW